MEEDCSREGATKAESASPSSDAPSSPSHGRRVVRLPPGRNATQAVFEGGKKAVCGPMVVYLLKNDLPQLRFAVHGRKVLGIAVERNRIKRLFREAVRKEAPLLVGYDVILVPRQASKGLSLSRLTQQLHRMVSQAR